MSLTFLYSFLIVVYVFFNQNLTSSQFVSSSIENDEDNYNISNAENVNQSESATKRVVGDDVNYYVCPTNKSSIDAEDIRTLIDYIYDTHFYKNKIISNYTLHAQHVAEKHLSDVNEIEDLIYNPEQHFERILEELTEILNDEIDPVVERIQIEVGEQPRLENEFKNKLKELHMNLQTLHDYKMICKYNCKEGLEHRVERYIKERRSFCTSLNDLYVEIKSKLSVVADNIKQLAHSLIIRIDKKLTKKVNAVRRKVDKAFLGKVGKTWVKILKIQNKNEEIREDLQKMINVSQPIEEIASEIDNKSKVVRRDIEAYGEFCRNCDIDGQNKTATAFAVNSLGIKATVVNDLIKAKSIRVWNAVKNHIKTFYTNLNAKLKRVKKVKVLKNQYEPSADQVTNLTKQSEIVFDFLNLISPQPSTKRVIEYILDSEELLREIEKKIQKRSDKI